MILEFLQQHEKKITFGTIAILLLIVALVFIKQCKEQPSKETRQIISKEQKIIDSLSRINLLLENKNEFLGNTIKQQDSQINKLSINYQSKKQITKQAKIEYLNRDSSVVNTDTACEKYVATLEETNDACDSIATEQNKQILSYKEKDEVTTNLLNNTRSMLSSTQTINEALKLEIKKRSKLFSVTVGPGLTYTTDKEIKAGGQVTVGLKIIEF